jgi:hypothetical protein
LIHHRSCNKESSPSTILIFNYPTFPWVHTFELLRQYFSLWLRPGQQDKCSGQLFSDLALNINIWTSFSSFSLKLE